MTYKGSNKQTKEIAQELGVATVLEGSVRKAGDMVRITVKFIDGYLLAFFLLFFSLGLYGLVK